MHRVIVKKAYFMLAYFRTLKIAVGNRYKEDIRNFLGKDLMIDGEIMAVPPIMGKSLGTSLLL